jgi:16S rRNA (guanine527-N7)-methyltransferase
VGLPSLRLTLVETRRRRVAFVELAIERLGLTNATVAACRIEDLHDRVDLCFARALAPPAEVWRLAEPLLRPEGRLVYFAGQGGTEADISGARSISLGTAVLERSGPLVIMAR